MVDLAKEFYENCEAEALEQISYLTRDMGAMAKLREEYPDDWEMQELTRAIMFDEGKLIESLKGEIQYARATIKKLG
jgi:hypothetical protein